MSADNDFDAWQKDWQASEPAADAGDLASRLRAQTAQQSRAQRLGLLAPMAVTIIVGGILILRAFDPGSTLDVAMAIEGWIFIAALWAATLWASRGTWRPLAETTQEFLALSIRRRRANLLTAPLAIGAYLVQFVAVVGLIGWLTGAGMAGLVGREPGILLGLLGVPVLLVWAWLYSRYQRAELQRLLRLRAELEEEPEIDD